MGQLISAEEFEQWRAWMILEEVTPAHLRLHRAQRLAAAHNGAVTRKSTKKLFVAADFLSSNPWAAAAPSTPLTARAIAAQVKAFNTWVN